MRHVVEEIAVPEGPAAPSYTAYCASLAVRNSNEADVLGSAAPWVDPDESLPYFQDQVDTTRRLFVARRGDQVVGQALLEVGHSDDAHIGWLFGGVLPGDRRMGIGGALFDLVEREAAKAGCTTFQTFVLHGASSGPEMLPALSGYGAIPLADAGVRFLASRGWALEQVNRWNLLDLSVTSDLRQSVAIDAHAVAGNAYRCATWTGPSPENHLADLAALHASLERDAPHAGLEVGTSIWTAERVRREETNELIGGRQLLTTVAEHAASGTLAAFTQLSLPTDPARPVTQGITVVHPGHRGHRLGRWIKAVNLLALSHQRPAATHVITGNAEENTHMIAINDALGFRAVGYTGAWKKLV